MGIIQITTPDPSSPTANLLGIRLHAVTIDTVIERLVQAGAARQPFVAAYVNIHTANIAADLPWLRDFLNSADLTYCDGIGLMLGARLAGIRLPGRYTPPDWFPKLAARYSSAGLSLYFLGTAPGVAEAAAARLNASLAAPLRVRCHHGLFDTAQNSPENEAVLADIAAFQPHLLVVGMGQPRQERWLMENRERLPPGARLPVGAMFDYLAGATRRAPPWMTGHGLEWLGRLLIEPRRLWRRYLIGNPRFFVRILKQRLAGSGRSHPIR